MYSNNTDTTIEICYLTQSTRFTDWNQRTVSDEGSKYAPKTSLLHFLFRFTLQSNTGQFK